MIDFSFFARLFCFLLAVHSGVAEVSSLSECEWQYKGRALEWHSFVSVLLYSLSVNMRPSACMNAWSLIHSFVHAPCHMCRSACVQVQVQLHPLPPHTSLLSSSRTCIVLFMSVSRVHTRTMHVDVEVDVEIERMNLQRPLPPLLCLHVQQAMRIILWLLDFRVRRISYQLVRLQLQLDLACPTY